MHLLFLTAWIDIFRVIGPAMPSRELLDAAAELTEAAGLLRYLLFTHNTLVLVSDLPVIIMSTALVI